ncbi:TcdA/TcdB pore-forming domain-containing protein [Pseudomonas sp. 6D_7.1_Bac1]|uniref:TcdA/TcdB pore-forming domain-containing protein n=1 Tax=Pseudomonas sp. 6D_7.1_Bac1 TaxID=2971615 RepID=UPI0021CA8C30|nr:TcdA/TcdB pore-forming domain-containing protein [Pseudomonas sp. 6D_7.1_Bac1]MCU1751004.1 T3SS effector HopA1 family protein [Pseudomonas sp. 6D_7.1_Bac1]
MPSNSYQSLLASAQATFKEMSRTKKVQTLIDEIKSNYRDNGKKWTPEALGKQRLLEDTLEKDAYQRYSNDTPIGVSGLDENEQREFVAYIKALAARVETVDILVQGSEKVALSSQPDSVLEGAEAFRVLPKDFAQRHGARAKVGARLTINVDKAHFNQLAQALTQLFSDDNRGWLDQAKIIGPKKLGSLTDQAVIYLSSAGVEYAQAINKKLSELLPATAFVEHTPSGMYRVGKGIAYSETAEGESSSHGQSRAKLIAAAGAQSLLTDTPIEKTLPRVLQTRGYDVRNPALLAQAVLDRKLKGGLVPMSGGAEPREGSVDIQQFITDPVLFAKSHTISAEALAKSGRLPAEGHAQLVNVTPGVYEVEYIDQSDHRDSVQAYFLGYNGSNQANASPAYVDIPKRAAPSAFLFTGTLSGCSLVVTTLDANTYRVYHDGRVNSSLLYDRVVMAVDYKDYQIPGTAEGLAAAYMQYINGEWQLVFQKQEYQREAQMLWPKLRNGEEPISIQVAGDQVVEQNQTEFATYREQVHQQLKKVAAQFRVSVEGITDGVYTTGEFSPHHPAIAEWTKLRDQVHAKINTDIQQLVDKRSQLHETRRNSTQTTLIDQQIKQVNLTLDYYKAQYDAVLREASSVEKTWLWQQIKAKNGTGAVVRIDDASIQDGGEERTSSLAEHYAITEAYQRGALGSAFVEGLRNFHETTIPGVDDKTSVLEMKRLVLEGQLTPTQKGALSGRITEVSQAEYIDKVLAQAAVFSEDFQGAGSTFSRLVPQDFYLSLVGDKSGGRCYPLVRAMAVALASGGEEGIDSLVEKLFLAAADPEAGSSTLLKNSLITLHSNVDAVQASTARGRVKLRDVVSRLAASTQTSMFALNTQGHSMMVGSTVGAEGRRYYFYDPNVGIFAFEDTNSLSKAMTQHLVDRKLAAHYGSLGSASSPIFNLVEIDTDKMAAVPLNRRLSVADLSRPGELVNVIETQHQVERTVNAQERVGADSLLRASLATFDAEQWGVKYHEASTRLALEAGLDYRWMPVIANTQKQGEGRYEVQFINREQPEETRWLTTHDAIFVEFRDFVDEHTSAMGEHYTLDRGQIRPKAGAGEAAPVDGLNSGFAVQALIRWFTDKSRQDAASGITSPELAIALKVHSYLNLAQMVHGGVQDVTKIIALVRTALRGEVVAAETSLKDFVSSLGHTVNEGVGVAFGGAFVVLDAYELAYAENEGQKAIYGTQLAFDSASFVSSAAGIGAGLLGASTAGAVLGGAGVILGGLAVGFTGLAQAFAPVAEDIKAVGRYFDAVDAAYKGNGYRYDDKQQVLAPLAGAVIKTLNLLQGQVEFDSQYIYRTHHGKTGSGKINYFFWGGDFPTIVRDRSQAIEVRSGIGYGSQHGLSHSDSKVVILPGTVKSYISYGYIHFPGATTRHDSGFDVIRRLEQDYRFDYDFYIFPSEYTVSRIHQEYVATPIDVVLDQRNRHLLVPELPKELHGYLHYEIKGGGGEYLIALNEGATVKLTSASASVPSRWIIDSNQLDSDHITVSKSRLVVGGVVVDLDSPQSERVLVISHKGEVREVDFARLTTQVVGEDASKWKVPGQPIEQYLRELAQKHQLNGQYVVVENYNHGGRNVGRGFYDVAKDRMLFTDTVQEQAKQGNLGAVIGDHAYFYDAENAAVWRVTIANGQVNAQFDPWFSQSAGKISRLWQEGDAVHLVRNHLLKDGSEAELSYRISGDQMELVSAVGDDALLRLSARTDQHGDAVKDLLKGYESNSTPRATPAYVLRAPLVKPINAALVTVFGKDAAGVAHRYWIRTSDGMVIKPNLAPPKDQTLRFQAHEQTRSAWPIPADLMLAGSMHRSNAKEVFFFYSKEQNVLFRQEGAGQAVLDANRPSALRITAPPLASVVDVNGNLIAITEDGRVAQLDVLGRLNYEAVNEHWLKGRTTWWKDLEAVNGKGATLAVFGIKGTDGKSVLPVWYHNGQVVVASAALQNKSLQFLEFEADGSAARLFEPQSGKLYRQPAMAPDALTAAFGADQVLKPSAQRPVASELAPELHLRAAEQVDTGMRLTTVKGEILLRANSGELQLVAVDNEWQKDNLSNLPQALAKVASQWRAKGVLTLQGKLAQGWFDVASGQVFWSGGVPAADNLRFLGIAPGEKAAYVYNPTVQTLYRVKDSGSEMLSHFTNAGRFGTSLLLQGGGSKDDLTAPIIAGVDKVVLHGGGADDTYRLSKAMWRHYPTVVIDNEDPGQALDRLIMAVANPEQILVSRHDDDLLLSDSDTGTVLVVRRVFSSSSAAHRHLQIELEGTSLAVSVDQLVKVFAAVGTHKDVLFALSWAIKSPPPAT